MRLVTKVRNFVVDESGPTAVEYAIMLGLVLMVCLVAIMLFGNSTSSSFNDSQQRMSNAGLGS